MFVFTLLHPDEPRAQEAVGVRRSLLETWQFSRQRRVSSGIDQTETVTPFSSFKTAVLKAEGLPLTTPHSSLSPGPNSRIDHPPNHDCRHGDRLAGDRLAGEGEVRGIGGIWGGRADGSARVTGRPKSQRASQKSLLATTEARQNG